MTRQTFTIIIAISLLTILLQGCSSDEEKNDEGTNNEQFQSFYMDDYDSNADGGTFSNGLLEVDFTTNPTALALNETSTLSVKVTSKGEPVTDALVVFEIWKEGEQNSIQVDTKPDDKGTYTVAGKFSETGNYNLVAHVSALGAHEMQIFQFTIKEK